MNEFFKQNQGNFDVFEPKSGHQERFLHKLQAKKKKKIIRFSPLKWRLAASVVLLLGLSFGFMQSKQLQKQKTPELRQNEQYFSMLIQEEIESVKEIKTKETEKVFTDAMQQIQALENDYKKLLSDYQTNKDKFIINAMIENFQQRIEILQFVKKQIHQIKESKKVQNEKYRL